MQGWGWQKVHHPDHVDRVVNRLRQCFAAGTPWEDTFPLRGRDGTYRWFLSRALPIRNEAGDLVRWFGTLTDVTEQIEAEKALRNLNETLEQRVETEARERARIWNVSQDLLVVADMKADLSRSIRPGTPRSAGPKESCSTRRSIGWCILMILQKREHNRRASPKATRRCISKIASGTSTARTAGCPGRRWPKKGKSIPSPGTSPISRIRRINCAFRAASLREVSRHTTMGAMAASIAHEVNQPLAALVTNANAGMRWLDKPEPDIDEVRKLLKRIVDDGHRAGAVIAGIRSMFRKDGGERKPVSVNDLIREVLAVVHGELESHQDIAAKPNCAMGSHRCWPSRHNCSRCILNLIMNAVDAMNSVADRERVVIVRSDMDGSDHALITVEDLGHWN